MGENIIQLPRAGGGVAQPAVSVEVRDHDGKQDVRYTFVINWEAGDKLAFSIDEAAERTSLSRDLINDLVRTGQLRSVKVGRRRIIPADAIHTFLSTEEKSPGGPHPRTKAG